ncbi:uncharacterized protein PV09_03962 [Verruconis gallopava]|uniref:Zn(2)-C6 fungal-type domain-containing protein n=1 Tax=Verruconis gallopava TaxID=253628 RepID=A0A0D1YVP5_9PEZI|nr:uncharacterized protein PV09_03962 [Verruconis gallopava]KIW04772.1 hypothetical protein PV09_03962 [Verruconis gallopava]
MLHSNETFSRELGLSLPAKRRSEPRRRRSYVRAACNSCRTRKVACDGERPVCNNCNKKGLHCAYVTLDPDETQTSALKRKVQELQDDLNDQAELINHLTNGPEDLVLDLIRQLRTTGNPSAVLHEIQHGTFFKRLRPSDHATARAVLPPSHINFALELTTIYPNSYPILEPINTASISINDLFTPKRGHAPLPTPVTRTPPLQMADLELKYPSPPPEDLWQVGPVQAPSYADQRLNQLRMNFWTSVPITDDFAASALSLYLRTDHPYQGFFDSDLFIRDLVDLKTDFCSSFLVASLMFYACQLYAAVDPRSSVISHAFYAQAEILWETERLVDSLTTTIALHLFSLGCLGQGKDRRSIQLVQEGREMAERLHLLNVPPNSMIERQFCAMSPEWQRATAHSAWGIYIWLTYRAFFYEDEGVLYPPMYPKPGMLSPRPIRLGEVQTCGSPHHATTILAALCELCVISQEVATVYYENSSEPIPARVPLAFAEAKYRKLLSWAERLPPDIVRDKDYREDVIVLHIFFHIVIISVFRPYINQPQMQRLHTFSSNDSSPRAVFWASVEQLKFLILIARLKHPHSINPVLTSAGHAHICSVVLANRSEPDWKFYFLLCVAYYREMYTRHHVFELLIQGVLALAMVNEAITVSEARKIMEGIKIKGRHHQTKEQPSAFFKIDFDQASQNSDDRKVDTLARKFEELATNVNGQFASQPT